MSTAKKTSGSGGKPGSKTQARERLREQRRQQAEQERRRRRMFQVTIALAVVVALALVGGAVLFNQSRSSGSSSKAIPHGATGQSGGLAFGSKSAPTLDVYEDFQCPVCGQLEAQSGKAITAMARANDVRVVYHMLSFLGPESVRAANAAGCAADEGKFLQLHHTLYANQPQEGTGGFTNDDLVALGKKAGLASSSYASCVKDGTYNAWVSRVERQGGLDNVTQTPTIKVNGKELARNQYTPAGITQAVQAAS